MVVARETNSQTCRWRRSSSSVTIRWRENFHRDA
jgi:hypothetical protein